MIPAWFKEIKFRFEVYERQGTPHFVGPDHRRMIEALESSIEGLDLISDGDPREWTDHSARKTAAKFIEKIEKIGEK